MFSNHCWEHWTSVQIIHCKVSLEHKVSLNTKSIIECVHLCARWAMEVVSARTLERTMIRIRLNLEDRTNVENQRARARRTPRLPRILVNMLCPFRALVSEPQYRRKRRGLQGKFGEILDKNWMIKGIQGWVQLWVQIFWQMRWFLEFEFTIFFVLEDTSYNIGNQLACLDFSLEEGHLCRHLKKMMYVIQAMKLSLVN